jgi:hypothetical protein
MGARDMTVLPRSKIAVVFTALVCLTTQGCALNSVREVQFKDVAQHAASTRIVFGVATQSAVAELPSSVVIEQYDPVTRKGGDCYRWNRAAIVASTTPSAVQYRVFKVPAGVYTYSFANRYALVNPAAFIVDQGKTVYIGDFILMVERDQYAQREIVEFRRNLPAAKAAFGPAAEAMELAPALPNAPRPMGFACTP